MLSIDEDKYQTRNEKGFVWISNGLWIISRFIYREKVRSPERQDEIIGQLTGFLCNLEFFSFFCFTFLTSYLSLSFFCVSKYRFLPFFHSVGSSGCYEGIRIGFLELGKDVGDTRNIFVVNSVNISIDWTRIWQRWARSKKFEEIWWKKMCSGHLSWKICCKQGWALQDRWPVNIFKLRFNFYLLIAAR